MSVSSTKPEVHNVLHCRQRRNDRATVTASQVTSRHTESFVKFGSVIFDVCEWTDRQTNTQTNKQTYRHADHNTSLIYRGGDVITVTRFCSCPVLRLPANRHTDQWVIGIVKKGNDIAKANEGQMAMSSEIKKCANSRVKLWQIY